MGARGGGEGAVDGSAGEGLGVFMEEDRVEG